jgi:2-polyprenyl-3-methyl-5-hydroxy-6-metoxy-1,4-benzoquinol methylase
MKDQSDKFYFNNPDIWESLRGHSLEKETNFINTIIGNKKHLKILDIGCGSGMHAARLQKLGHEVTGIDLNENMIRYAKENYLECTFLQMNMTEISTLKERYDVIVCICTTLCYLTDNKALNKFMTDVHSLLNPGGIFIFDVFNPIAYLEKLPFEGNYFGESKEGYTEAGLKLTVKHEIDEATQILTETKIVQTEDGKSNSNGTKFRMFFPQEIRYLLALAGCVNVEQYGKYISNYKKLDSTRIVTVCEKKD